MPSLERIQKYFNKLPWMVDENEVKKKSNTYIKIYMFYKIKNLLFKI